MVWGRFMPAGSITDPIIKARGRWSSSPDVDSLIRTWPLSQLFKGTSLFHKQTIKFVAIPVGGQASRRKISVSLLADSGEQKYEAGRWLLSYGLLVDSGRTELAQTLDRE